MLPGVIVFVFTKVSARFECFYIIWPDSLRIRHKAGQNRSIELQSYSESAPNFTRKNKHTYEGVKKLVGQQGCAFGLSRKKKTISELHDDVILLQLPESFSLLRSCAIFFLAGLTNINKKGKTKWILVVVVKCRHRENGLHQFLEPVTLCWIKEEREQNSTALENALFPLVFGLTLFVHFRQNGQRVGQCDGRIEFLFWTFDHRVSTSNL